MSKVAEKRVDDVLALESLEFARFVDERTEELQRSIMKIKAAHSLPSGVHSGLVDEKIGEAYYEHFKAVIGQGLKLRGESAEHDRSVLLPVHLAQLKQGLRTIADNAGRSWLEIDHRDKLRSMVDRGIEILRRKRPAGGFETRMGHVNAGTTSTASVLSDREARKAAELGTQWRGAVQDWQKIEIRLLSEFGLQVFLDGKAQEPSKYSEIGLADLRTGKPKMVWQTLRELAENRGVIHQAPDGRWSTEEKRVQELRKALRCSFGISSDPLPFVRGTGYRAAFKIMCAPSYRLR